MDASITAAGRALRAGDPLGALGRVALRDDPAALALRGIAMAQLGDLGRARELLRRAARGFGPRETLARARCLTAEAEVALAARDLAWAPRALSEALRTFAARGERDNAAHARLLQIRRLLLLGRVDEADVACARLELDAGPARLAAVAALVTFEIALRRGRAERARAALARAREAAARSGIGALRAEIEQAGRALVLPAARLVAAGEARSLTLAEVEAVLTSSDLVVDGCRRAVRRGERVVRLARRPALFALLCGLAEAWPGEAARDGLIQRAFGARRTNASHRARLRVAMGRLRHTLRPLAGIRATAGGFCLVAPEAGTVRLLAPPIESPDAAVLALLADGEAWSTSALALALGSSQRTVQRALAALEEAGQVRALGRGRSRRWLSAPVAGFATSLLLPVSDGHGQDRERGRR
ncbi:MULTISPECIES: helix-turn-helix domain-containing protein [Anaeromyxobacter]|uniref:helix-turn-helix domain-containing protein n=1 Tax=Anaeromyxobacter TaxID=161492 RepID=UPI001F598BA6|nr:MULTISPECIES: helix-turn-helix domain-containing protein [unclassified Anaeromyxobacter]